MKTITIERNKNRFFKGLDFFSFALEIFAFIGFLPAWCGSLERGLYRPGSTGMEAGC